MKKLSDRAMRIQGKGAFGVWERAMELEAQGVDMIHLEIGEPDFDTPPHIVEAANQAMRSGRTKYGRSNGTPGLRDAIADYVAETRGMRPSPDNIVVSPGVKGTMYGSIMAIAEEGDEVLMSDPGFMSYHEIIRLSGAEIRTFPLYAEQGFQPDPAVVEAHITPRTKILVLNSPSNPTGTIYTQKTLEGLADVAIRHDLWVMSDEIYYQIYFTDEPPPSLWSLPGMAERTILMDGFSKAYSMTGWRLGYGVVPDELAGPLGRMMVNNHSCVPPFLQDAAEAALRGSQDCVAEMREAYRHRRDRVLAGIESLPGVTAEVPDGAFYVMLDMRALGVEDIVYRFLDAGVALLPGEGFGERGRGFLRLAYICSDEVIDEAFRRMRGVLENL